MANKKNADNNLVYKVLDDAKEGQTSVGLYATGEPFLNKNLEDYIKYTKKLDTNMFTSLLMALHALQNGKSN